MGSGGGLWVHTWSCSPGKGPEPFGGCVWSCLLLPLYWGWGLVPLGLWVLGAAHGSLCQRGRENFTVFFLLLYFFSRSSPPTSPPGRCECVPLRPAAVPSVLCLRGGSAPLALGFGGGRSGGSASTGPRGAMGTVGAVITCGRGEDRRGAGSRGAPGSAVPLLPTRGRPLPGPSQRPGCGHAPPPCRFAYWFFSLSIKFSRPALFPAHKVLSHFPLVPVASPRAAKPGPFPRPLRALIGRA